MRRNVKSETEFAVLDGNSVFLVEFLTEIGKVKLESADAEALKLKEAHKQSFNKSATDIIIFLTFKHFYLEVVDRSPVNLLGYAVLFVLRL